ncbi:MAG TPA: hypothetical protein ENN84_06255 [Candidatus Marinimicrobia bacterium]|nr:hypothetical protein [Candidatus Neomarinimicrobiota bacterium]
MSQLRWILAVIMFVTFASAQPVGQFLKVSKDVQIMGEADADFRAGVSVGTVINARDQVRTGVGSFAVIVFTDDKSIIKIRENTTLEIREDATVRMVNIEEGKAMFDIAQQKNKEFRVQTPITVASVKGTEFWVVTIDGIDKIFTMGGAVEVLNRITNETLNLTPGQMCIMTQMGQSLLIPFSPDELPDESIFNEAQPETIPEEAEPSLTEEAEEDTSEASPSESYSAPASVTVDDTGQPEIPEEPADEGDGSGFGLGVGVGSATIDGKIYNQVALRPSFNIGKIGVGLDMAFYIDQEGKIRKDDWDNPAAILDKIYFLSWGKKNQDPFYIRVGGLENVTISNGIAVSGYTNMLDYPDVKRMGTEFSLQTKKYGLEGFIADWKELGGESSLPGLVGGRAIYKMKMILPIHIGVSGVADLNPYNAFDKDSDGDGFADLMDFYPDYADDAPYDYLDVDYNGLIDPIAGLPNNVLQAIISSSTRFTGIDNDSPKDTLYIKPLSELMENSPTIYSVGADLTIPILNLPFLGLNIYSEGSILGYNWTDWSTGKKDNFSRIGTAPLGVSATIIKIINARVEYRWAQDNFVYGFFDRNYDIGRVGTQIITDSEGKRYIVPKTRYDYIRELNLGTVQGVFGSASVELFGLGQVQAAYMNMFSATDNLQTFQATAGIKKGLVPKVSQALAYYQRNNDQNPFDFMNPSQNTLLGYKVGLEVSPGVSIIWNFMQTYRDKNGDGVIDPKMESLKVMSIETGFSF